MGYEGRVLERGVIWGVRMGKGQTVAVGDGAEWYGERPGEVRTAAVSILRAQSTVFFLYHYFRCGLTIFQNGTFV